MEISEVPAGFFDKLTNLTDLDLGVNNLSEVPEGLFDNLTNLDGSGPGLQRFH